MDLKTHILRWQRDIQDNPALVALVVFIVIALLFLAGLIFDMVFRRRRDKIHRRK